MILALRASDLDFRVAFQTAEFVLFPRDHLRVVLVETFRQGT